MFRVFASSERHLVLSSFTAMATNKIFSLSFV